MYFNSDLNRMVYSGDVTAATITGGTINIGNNSFTVDASGNMIANNGTLRGSVYASNGTIGGWIIDNNKIYSPTNANIYLESTDGIINGATIISAGANGTTTISGGTVESVGASQQSNLFHIYNGNYNTYIAPNSIYVQLKESDVINQQTIIGTGVILVSDQNYNTKIYPNSINSYKGFIKNCTNFESWENANEAIPNIGWVNSKILTVTPTSDSTSTDKAPSYYACASMIRNIKNYVDNKLSTAYNNGYSAGYSVGYSAGYSAGAASSSGSSSS